MIRIYLRVLGALGAERRLAGALVLANAVLAAAQFGEPVLFGRIIDRVTGAGAGGWSAVVFLAGQILAWRQLTAAGYVPAANPADAFFYLITAVHGLHLLGGLVALGRTVAKAWPGVVTDQLRLSVELCAMYWHFLLLVWLVMFGILLLT